MENTINIQKYLNELPFYAAVHTQIVVMHQVNL